MADVHYPMIGCKSSFTHSGGTKEYFLTMLSNAQGLSIVVRRYGPVGKTGQLKVKKFNTTAEAKRDYESEVKLRTSTSKNYIMQDEKNIEVKIGDDLIGAFGRTVYPKLGADNVLHLDPDRNVTGMREPESNRTDDGSFTGEIKRRVTVDPDVAARIEKEVREKELDSMRSNPKFGVF